VGLTGSQRRHNLRGAFAAEARQVSGRSVILFDDVYTTGSTVNECSKALRAAGAAEVVVFTLARALGKPEELWELA
jgi:predicted amidophosphoribosyltransferase